MDTSKARHYFEDLSHQLEEIRSVRDITKKDAFERRTRMLIRQFFPENSDYLNDLNKIYWHNTVISAVNEYEEMEDWTRGWNKSNNLIKTILEDIEIQDTLSKGTLQHKGITGPLTNKVFIVHGHDEAMKEAVARTLGKLDLEPIILHEQPNKGRTIIEKFSDYSDVGFAIILLTGDDIAYSKDSGVESKRPRARQNVILELGYFIGRLGRDRVLPLYKEEPEFEIPTDYSGVVFTPFDNAGRWQFDLAKELKAVGYSIDVNRLIS